MSSDMSCPKCQSENTQKISLIIEQGTVETEGQSNTFGSAIGSDGSYASGSSTTTINTSSQSQLAKKLETEIDEYRKKVGGSPIMGAYVLLTFIGVPAFIYAGYKAASFFHATWIGWCVGISLFIVGAVLIDTLDKKGWFAPDEKTKVWWDRLDRWGEAGCYCHRCGNKFIPGSNEPHFTTLKVE